MSSKTEFHAAAIAFWSSDYGESSYVIRNCIFNNNSSKAEGGAIYITASDSVKIYNSLFTNNYSVNNKGGAIGIFSSDVVVTNCTFYNNESGAYIPEGASIFDDNNYGERLTINNSIMWGEQEIQLMYYDTDHWAYDGHAQPVVSNSLIKVEGTEAIFPGTNNLNTDPVFEDAVNLVLMLQASSPCLNSGNNGLCPEDEDFYHDIAGKSRIYNNDTIDMGCYEFQGEANTTFYNEMETIQLSTYPNPSTEKVIIELPNNYVDSKLEIFSITGTLVYQQKNNTNKLDINISDLITGTHLVRITNKTGGAVNSKLLKR